MLIYDLKNNIEKTLGKVIVTSGPTIEAIDDVKVITNKSSGKKRTISKPLYL